LKLLGNPLNPSSLSSAIATEKANLPHTSSAILALVYHFIAIYRGTESFVLSKFDSFIANIVAVSGNFSSYLHFLLSISIFLVGKKELLRVVGPTTFEEEPKVSAGATANLAFWLVILGIFVYFPILGEFEKWAREHPDIAARVESGIVMVEEISGEYYQPGTSRKIAQIKLQTISQIRKDAVERLEKSIDVAFDKMEANVDNFLDWYYSLPAEFVRTVKLVTGKLESYLEKELCERLTVNNPFSGVNQEIDKILANYEEVKNELDSKIREILEKNRVQVSPGEEVEVVKRVSLDDVFTLEFPEEVINFKERLAGGSVSGAVSGVIIGRIVAKKLTAKLVSKGILKSAAKSLLKVAEKKAVGKLIGSFLGVVVGGTTAGPVGAIVGAAAGFAVGLVVDKVFLEVEEALDRDKFKQEIISQLEELREEYKEMVRKSFGAD
jgi:hypothetical protein